MSKVEDEEELHYGGMDGAMGNEIHGIGISGTCGASMAGWKYRGASVGK